MKVTKRLSVLLLTVIMMLSVVGIQASAAETAVQDGLQVTLTTDKQEYTKNDKINATVTVKNYNTSAVTDVDLEAIAPEGFKVAANTPASKTVESLAAGESVEHNVTYVIDSIKSPETGSKTDFAVVLVLSLTIAAAGFVAFKANKQKQLLSLCLVAAVVGSVALAAPVSVSADEVSASPITVDKTVVFDSKDVVIKEVVTYVPAVVDENGPGYVSGKVVKASDRTTPISDVDVKIYQGNQVVTTVRTDEAGSYNVELMNGDYLFEIEAEGYIKFACYAHVNKGETTYLETFLLIEGDENDIGVASGKITDATTGNGLEGVQLEVRRNWNNASNGDVITTTTTDAEGNYKVELNLGNYSLLAIKDGYVSSVVNIIVLPGETGNQNGSISPVLSGSDYRIVLTWGEDPRDMDSHVVGKTTSGNEFHVYYAHKSVSDGDTEICNLDVDDRYSYGPETITLHANNIEPYYYYVYHYAGSGTVATSNAKVEVYQGERLISTYSVPANQECDTNWYWNVFAIRNGNIIVNNTLTEVPNTEYAN